MNVHMYVGRYKCKANRSTYVCMNACSYAYTHVRTYVRRMSHGTATYFYCVELIGVFGITQNC